MERGGEGGAIIPLALAVVGSDSSIAPDTTAGLGFFEFQVSISCAEYKFGKNPRSDYNSWLQLVAIVQRSVAAAKIAIYGQPGAMFRGFMERLREIRTREAKRDEYTYVGACACDGMTRGHRPHANLRGAQRVNSYLEADDVPKKRYTRLDLATRSFPLPSSCLSPSVSLWPLSPHAPRPKAAPEAARPRGCIGIAEVRG